VENVHDAGKREVPHHEGLVSPEYLYPVLRGKDIDRWHAEPEYLVLMLQNAQTRVGREPAEIRKHMGTWKFVSAFERQLRARRSAMLPKVPFYSIYGVGRATFSSVKVLWGRVGNTVAAAVAEPIDSVVGRKPALPFEAMMIAFDDPHEAHFVCGCLNSTPAQLVVVGSIALHPDTHVLRRVAIPRFNPKISQHESIASLSNDCHAAVAQGKASDLPLLEKALDENCAQLWGITSDAVESMRRCLMQMRGMGDGDNEDE
jgi:hypothetical protein